MLFTSPLEWPKTVLLGISGIGDEALGTVNECNYLPSLRAVVAMALTSEPALGSVRLKVTNFPLLQDRRKSAASVPRSPPSSRGVKRQRVTIGAGVTVTRRNLGGNLLNDGEYDKLSIQDRCFPVPPGREALQNGVSSRSPREILHFHPTPTLA